MSLAKTANSDGLLIIDIILSLKSAKQPNTNSNSLSIYTHRRISFSRSFCFVFADERKESIDDYDENIWTDLQKKTKHDDQKKRIAFVPFL